MGLCNELSCEPGSSSCCLNPHRCFQSEVLRLYFSTLASWVTEPVWLLSCSSQSIHSQMWDHQLSQQPPCCIHQPLSGLPLSTSHCLSPSPLHLGCPSLPLLQVWMNFSSLMPWLLDFHTIRFSISSGYFLFLNLSLSLFWLCEEVKYIDLHLHLGQKSSQLFFLRRMQSSKRR